MQWEGILSWPITRRQVSRDLWILRPSPVIAHWVSHHQILLQNWEWAFPATRGKKWSWKTPQSMVGFMTTRGLCQLQIGTYQEHCQWLNHKGICHLHLHRLNPMLPYLLTFNNPWGSSGWSGHSVLQGIWWDRSSDSWMFLGTDFMISIFSSPRI